MDLQQKCRKFYTAALLQKIHGGSAVFERSLTERCKYLIWVVLIKQGEGLNYNSSNQMAIGWLLFYVICTCGLVVAIVPGSADPLVQHSDSLSQSPKLEVPSLTLVQMQLRTA